MNEWVNFEAKENEILLINALPLPGFLLLPHLRFANTEPRPADGDRLKSQTSQGEAGEANNLVLFL